MKLDAFDKRLARRDAVIRRGKDPLVADNYDVRKALMQRVYDGTSTLEEIQAELKAIKSRAKKNGAETLYG